MGGNDQNRAEKQNVVLTWFRPVTWSSGHLGRLVFCMLGDVFALRWLSYSVAGRGVVKGRKERLIAARSAFEEGNEPRDLGLPRHMHIMTEQFLCAPRRGVILADLTPHYLDGGNSTLVIGFYWRVPNPPGANPLVAERALWRSSQSCVTGGQQPIGNPCRFLSFLLRTWQPLCDPNSHLWGSLFQLPGG